MVRTCGVGPARVAGLPAERRAHGVGRADAVRELDQVLGRHGAARRARNRRQLLLGLVDGGGLRQHATRNTQPAVSLQLYNTSTTAGSWQDYYRILTRKLKLRS